MTATIDVIRDNIISFKSNAGTGIAICNNVNPSLIYPAEVYFEIDFLVELTLNGNTSKTSDSKCKIENNGDLNYFVLLVEFIDHVNDYYQVGLRLQQDCIILGEFIELNNELVVGDYVKVNLSFDELRVTLA